MARPAYVSREKFFDGHDEKKWSNHAIEQLRDVPPGSTPESMGSGNELQAGTDDALARYLKKNNIQGTGVEFGCGTSIHRNRWNGMHYVGIDGNPGMIKGSEDRWAGRENKGVLSSRWFLTTLNTITDNCPELIGIGDAGSCITVLQHNHYEDGKEIMDQIYKVLKPGAPFFFVEGTYAEQWFPAENRVKYGWGDSSPIDPDNLDPVRGSCIFTEKGWRNFMSQHGFEIIFAENSTYIAIRQ